MKLVNQLLEHKTKLAVVGLGYVGLPLAEAFSRKMDVIGYDIDGRKIEKYRNNIDPTREIGSEALQKTTIEFTSDPADLKEASFIIVSVPTPVKADHTPDLEPVISASHEVGKYLSAGATVVFESTVYPGVTREICLPILEEQSGLKCGIDFQLGYSPERINPGDKVHRLENTKKIVSGMDQKTLSDIASVYEQIILAGVYRAETIEIAEAAKIMENSQRDINIAFMNEMAMIFHKMDIDTKSVIQAASTKWNFLRFYPGLVGGHCIGIDPYYMTYRTEQFGYHSQIILAGRHVNDDMGRYTAGQIVKFLLQNGIQLQNAKVAVFGITFKENCPDTRNTKVVDIIRELEEYRIHPVVVDPEADAEQTERLYGIPLTPIDQIHDLDVLIVAVGHKEFQLLKPYELASFFSKEANPRALADIKGIYDKRDFATPDWIYWRL